MNTLRFGIIYNHQSNDYIYKLLNVDYDDGLMSFQRFEVDINDKNTDLLYLFAKESDARDKTLYLNEHNYYTPSTTTDDNDFAEGLHFKPKCWRKKLDTTTELNDELA